MEDQYPKTSRVLAGNLIKALSVVFLRPNDEPMRIALLALPLLIFACSPSPKSDDQEFRDSLNVDSLGTLVPGINDQFVEGILQQIPSPVEVSSLLKTSGMQYEKDLLNAPENISKYNTVFSKALNVGVYGSDLYYTNIYGKNKDAIGLLTSIKQLANDLDIGQFFDMEVISRLAGNSDDIDSLLLISTQNFNNINLYLQERKRSELSVVMLTGGWIEAMNVLCQAYLHNPNHPEIRENIGSQKTVLEKLLLLYPFYQSDKHIFELEEDMKELEQAYSEVLISGVYEKPTIEVVNGVGIIRDNSKETVTITDEQVRSIALITAQIREKIVN